MEILWEVCETGGLQAVHRWNSSHRVSATGRGPRAAKIEPGQDPQGLELAAIERGAVPYGEGGGEIANSGLEGSPAQNRPTTLEKPSP